MSYLTLPRLCFSGVFQANVSTLNNTPANYNPKKYSNIEHMENVALAWNPMGNGGFTFKDCVVTRVDYTDGSSATSQKEDPIVGQPVSAVRNSGFPVAATLVDLDVQQQMVSEIWALTLEIGDSAMGVRGDFAPAAFNSMWGQAIGPEAPSSSASSSAVYQSTLKNATWLGNATPSRFLSELQNDSADQLSIQFIVNSHNNNPEVFQFNTDTFNTQAKKGVPAPVLKQLLPLQKLSMNKVPPPRPVPGDLPTKEFTLFALKQHLSVDDFNANVDTIMSTTRVKPYQGFTPNEFTWGSVAGAVGTSSPEAPDFFVPSRMMNVPANILIEMNEGKTKPTAWYAPFNVSENGLKVTLNLGNSLATDLPGQGFARDQLGELWLVSFADGNIDADNVTQLTQIDYTDPGFMTERAGIVTYQSTVDVSETPLGLLSVVTADGETTTTVLLAENPEGWYLRADRFVFRMNPGVTSSSENPFGDTATLNIHAMQFGKPAPDGTPIQLVDYYEGDRQLGVPASALTVSPAGQVTTASGGVASFSLTATDPGNPRDFLNGQLYFRKYNLADSANSSGYAPAPSDFVSIQVYDQEADGDAIAILGEYGRMYLIMSFLADQQAIEGIDLRNMIKLLLEKPMVDAMHMPVTRDLSFANLQRIVSWVDDLNNS